MMMNEAADETCCPQCGGTNVYKRAWVSMNDPTEHICLNDVGMCFDCQSDVPMSITDELPGY